MYIEDSRLPNGARQEAETQDDKEGEQILQKMLEEREQELKKKYPDLFDDQGNYILKK